LHTITESVSDLASGTLPEVHHPTSRGVATKRATKQSQLFQGGSTD
jgi:hypothetical protein